jgi:hypothetical protein
MDKRKGRLGAIIIASAIIWAAVITGCALELKGSECYSEIQFILSGGVVAHIILIWGPMVVLFRKIKDKPAD